MPKYIECETLISALESEFEDNENCRLFVSEIPTADVFEVVRCKDCEFVKSTKIKLNGKDLRNCDLYKRPCFDNDFCSRGVLKEREG